MENNKKKQRAKHDLSALLHYPGMLSFLVLYTTQKLAKNLSETADYLSRKCFFFNNSFFLCEKKRFLSQITIDKHGTKKTHFSVDRKPCPHF